ncbi:hypothetical protein ASE74_16020 [Pedobacter sp. Leaf216]|uniref:hypothetical protein n=1 Tax=Pedobacter sp. Leaf216 TaxID=1735684 RepID=UPI0006FD429B|nr:hypothetical protein [Pedobacter sp. Leaf216]KQM77906.1 hypothetical protein ASE74_16020 [Pedobacter sp. Leaf216]
MSESPVIVYDHQAEITSNFLIESLKTLSSSSHIQLQNGSVIKNITPYPRANLLKTKKNYLVVKNVKVNLLESERLLKINGLHHPDVGLIFIDCQLPSLFIHGSAFGGIVLYNSSINGSLTIDLSNLGDFLLDNCSTVNIKFTATILAQVRLGNVLTKNLEFTGCSVQDFTLDKTSTGYLRLSDSSLGWWSSNNAEHGYVFLSSGCQVGFLEFKNSSALALEASDITTSLTLSNAQIPFVELNNCVLSALEINTGTKSEVNLMGCRVNLLKLERVVISKETIFTAINCSFAAISIVDAFVAGQLLFKNVCIDGKRPSWNRQVLSWPNKKQKKSEIGHYDALRSAREALVSGISSLYDKRCSDQNILFGMLGCLRMIGSSMGKTEIIGSDLTHTRVEYKNTNLLDIFVAGTKFPSQVFIDGCNLDSVDYYHQRIDYFSQMRKIYEKQGDMVKALGYSSEMMDNQQKFFATQLKSFGFLKRYFSERSFLNYTLFLNNVSNRHGNSWMRALVFVLLGGGFLFIPTVWSMRYDLAFGEFFNARGYSFLADVDIIKGNLRYYSVFLNPARPFDYISKQQGFVMGNCYFFWDLFSRVIIGFGIYQFIVAFRRPGKI